MKTILVVEDDADMRGWITTYLRNAGYAVHSAADGLEAATACLLSKPDLVVSDLYMPGLSGFDMIRILNTEASLKHIPVIFLTAAEDRRKRGDQLGAAEYLVKPVDPEELLAAVTKHCPTLH